MSGHRILDSVHVVLVEPTHPGNIGATARAMKTMGLSRLHLVRPRDFPSAEATARAAGADDVLSGASVHDDFVSAIARFGWVVATTNRERRLPVEVLTPPSFAARLPEKAGNAEVALVFGRESSGLSNRELEHCHALITIPTAAGFASLNVAAAVQVMGYEILRTLLSKDADVPPENAASPPASIADMERFFQSLENTLVEIGYLDPAAPRRLMRRLRRFFNRAHPDAVELNILMGVLAAARSSARSARASPGRGETKD